MLIAIGRTQYVSDTKAVRTAAPPRDHVIQRSTRISRTQGRKLALYTSLAMPSAAHTANGMSIIAKNATKM